nr:hypothetical protein Iba_chr15cCG3470 [Ipomoea batatas]
MIHQKKACGDGRQGCCCKSFSDEAAEALLLCRRPIGKRADGRRQPDAGGMTFGGRRNIGRELKDRLFQVNNSAPFQATGFYHGALIAYASDDALSYDSGFYLATASVGNLY